MPYGRVLIVDDVETNLLVAKGLMMPYGLKIELAVSGYETIDKIKAGNVYDIIFMDHMMPKMDGIETVKQLRDMGYSSTIIALTANAIAGQADMFMKNGFDDFISKPIDVRQLNVSLNKFIRDKQPSEVLEAANKEKMELIKKGVLNQGFQQIDMQIAGVFARDAGKAISALQTCLDNNLKNENDIQMYIINVHSMKSALANIGEQELSMAAQKLEEAGRVKNFNEIFSNTKDFLDKLTAVIKEIKSRITENETDADNEDAIAFLNEKLVFIKEACAIYDKKTVKKLLNDLKERIWSHDTNELLDSISGLILHSEFDEASALLEKNIKQN